LLRLTVMGNVKRIGIFGGSFDPVHLGHIKLALSAKKEYKLDSVIFVPARRPPHKRNKNLLSGNKRRKMLSLALKPFPCLSIDAYELKKRAAAFTYRTMEHYRSKFPDSKLYFIAGGDSLAEMRTWKNPERILELSELIVGRRKGAGAAVPLKFRGRVNFLKRSLPGISSSEIRGRIKKGTPVSGLVPPEVEKYIVKNELYN
jgi:nicotinate-nucleotide adenylyltransferase